MRIAPALLLVAASGLFAQQAPEPELPFVMDVEVRLQQLYVTVTNPRGDRVIDLEQDAFSVFDDRRRQQIVTFQGGEIPITAVLVVDGSESMRGAPLKAARTGVEAFVEGMRQLDEASALVFSDRLLCRTPFTSSSDILRSGMDGLEAAGGSAVHDYLYLSLKLLEERQGRRVAILLSDGADGHSVVSFDQLDRIARLSQSLVYWVRVRDGGQEQVAGQRRRTDLSATAWTQPSEGRRDQRGLGKLVRRSGGRIVEIDRISEVEWAFREILSELREQYAIGYYPSPAESDVGHFRSVKVKVEPHGLTVRAREGYMDR